MAYKEQSYIGNGKLWLKKRGSSDPMREIGNCSAASFGVTSEESSLPNYRGGGGEANKRSRITAVSLNITAHDFSAENIALATRGDVSAGAAGAVAAEVQPGVDSGLIPTDALIDVTQTVTVTGPSATPVHVEGTDFTVSAAGIEVIEGGAITSAADVEISYQSLATDIVDTLMNSGDEYEVIFDGLNEAQSGDPVVIYVWRGKSGAADEVATIGDDYGSLSLPFAVLLDSVKEAAGQSPYYRVVKKAAA